MTLHSASELRNLADHYREMSRNGDDVCLKASLILLADEFEQEAANLQKDVAEGTSATRLGDGETVPPASETVEVEHHTSI